MKKEILIIKNIERENPGLLEDIIKIRGIKYSIVNAEALKQSMSVDMYGAFIVLGGPDSANDNNRKMKNELTLIRKVLDAKIPYLGICLGLQTMVKAAGGQVVKSIPAEVGFRDQNGDFYTFEVTEEGRNDELFRSIILPFNVFQLHGETVLLTNKMKLLAEGKFCRNQVVKIGSNAYGMQFHTELTNEMLERWIDEDPDLKTYDKSQLLADFAILNKEYSKSWCQFLHNFLSVAGYE